MPMSAWPKRTLTRMSTCSISPILSRTTPTSACTPELPYSWTLGLTATIPLYNRNQGNIARAKINVEIKTQLQASSQERQVTSDVLNAAQELEQSYISVLEYRREIIPASARMRDAARKLYETGATSILDFLEAQLAFNDVVKQVSRTRWCATAGRSWTSTPPSANASCRDWSLIPGPYRFPVNAARDLGEATATDERRCAQAVRVARSGQMTHDH